MGRSKLPSNSPVTTAKERLYSLTLYIDQQSCEGAQILFWANKLFCLRPDACIKIVQMWRTPSAWYGYRSYDGVERITQLIQELISQHTR